MYWNGYEIRSTVLSLFEWWVDFAISCILLMMATCNSLRLPTQERLSLLRRCTRRNRSHPTAFLRKAEVLIHLAAMNDDRETWRQEAEEALLKHLETWILLITFWEKEGWNGWNGEMIGNTCPFFWGGSGGWISGLWFLPVGLNLLHSPFNGYLLFPKRKHLYPDLENLQFS